LDDEPLHNNEYKSRLNIIADFHGQHEQQYIMNKEIHIEFLDTYAKLKDQVFNLESIFNEMSQSKQKRKKILENRSKAEDRKELIAFQLQEINLIHPEPGEDDALHEEFKN